MVETQAHSQAEAWKPELQHNFFQVEVYGVSEKKMRKKNKENRMKKKENKEKIITCMEN